MSGTELLYEWACLGEIHNEQFVPRTGCVLWMVHAWQPGSDLSYSSRCRPRLKYKHKVKHGNCGVYKPNEICNIGHTSSNELHHPLLTYLLTDLLTYLFTYVLIPWSSVLLQKLTGLQLIKKFPALYGTQTFIPAFKSGRHLSLFWASSIQFIPHIPLTEDRS